MPGGPRTLLSNVRWYTVNMLAYMRQGGRDVPANAPVVCFDLHANRWHRYLHILVLFFAKCGYVVRIRHRYGFIATWSSQDLFRSAALFRLYRSKGSERNARWVFTDHAIEHGHVLLDARYYPLPGEKEQGLRIPMPLVDTFYLHGLPDDAGDADQMRQRAVFFFGNMDPKAYGQREPAEVFNCFTRTELIDIVRRRFPERLHTPTDGAGIITRSGRDIILVDRRDRYITPDRLLGVLRGFDFFLAPSGVVMPLCHNLVEAIAAGCIPILQHPHLMVPPLEHGRNCLAFRDEDQLVTILERIPAMTAEEIQAMRTNVLAYYRTYLTPKAVISRMEQEGTDLRRMHLNGELQSTNILRDELVRAGLKGLPLPQEW